MATFIMLTRLAPESLKSPQTLEELEKQATAKVRQECPEVKWLGNYAVLGPYDYVDIFSAPDIEAATKVSALIRTYGHAHTEIWAATEWARFKDLMRHLPGTKG